MQTSGSKEVVRMSKTVSVSSGVLVALLMLILMTLGWSAIAQAQEEGPFDDQYDNRAPIPTADSTDNGSYSGTGVAGVTGTGDSSVAAADRGGSSVAGIGAGSASASAAGVAGLTGVLPSTGGATLLTLGAGVFLAGSGLVVRRLTR